jgi:hypothetical protein
MEGAMQLKLQRSQREGGVMSKNVIFCLDARVEFTPAEQQSITKYKLHKQVIYNSEASKRALEGGAARVDGSTVGHLKSLAFTALAAMNLNISIESLQRGQHIECKSMDELLGAEGAIMDACRNLRGYLDTAATFDGREVLVDFSAEEPTVIASAPAPMLVAPGPTPVSAATIAAAAAPVPRLVDATEVAATPVPARMEPKPEFVTGFDGQVRANESDFAEALTRWFDRLTGVQKVALGAGSMVALWIIISIVF